MDAGDYQVPEAGRGRLSQPLPYLSGFIERHRDDDYRGLIEETTGRSWGRQYLARGVLAAVADPGGER